MPNGICWVRLYVVTASGLMGYLVVRAQGCHPEDAPPSCRSGDVHATGSPEKGAVIALEGPASSAGASTNHVDTRSPGTPAALSSPLKAHDGYRHEAFLWKGEQEFLYGSVPFIRDGLRAGQPVLLAVIQGRIELLRAALGDDAHLVEFVDMAELGRNPARIIPAVRAFMEQHAADGQPVRAIGEPIWAGRRPAEVAECQLQEALLNLTIDPGTPLWLLCSYDVHGLAPDVLTEAHRSHPALVEQDTYRGSTLYGGAHHAVTVFETDLPPADVPAWCRRFGAGDLVAVREDVIGHALGAGVPSEPSADLALAVHEVATNSLVHGSGSGDLRIWREAGALVCEVHDEGHISDPMRGRVTPTWENEGGRGLWIANQLCDLVQIRSGAAGTTIRIHTWL
jgi:anti-sigma regulatory factor (Ser/Thr protein kinase)